MKDRIIEMLERGERVELELADKIGFIEQGASHHVADGLQRGINTVCSVDSDNNVVIRASGLDDMLLAENDCYLKYFKIKEPEHTFNGLIDVAVKAWEDGFLKILKLEKGIVNQVFTVIDGIAYGWHDGDDDYSHAIDTIKSLYTETFVIESEEDEMKIRQPVKSIILANGEEIINEDRLSLLQNGLCLKAGAAGNIKIPFSLLKGATVTQKRGN